MEISKDAISDFGIEKLILVDWEGTTFINPFNPTQSTGKLMANGIKETDLKETDNKFHNQIKQNLEKRISEHQSGDNYILTKYLWLYELLMWNMNPEASKIKFEYLLK